MQDDTSNADHEMPPGQELTLGKSPGAVGSPIMTSVVVPAIVADAGEQATRRFLEFFAATI